MNWGADPPLNLRWDDPCRASLATLGGRESPASAAKVCRPTPETLPLRNRSYRLKSQIKSVLTWHTIEYLTRSNNINDLRPAERPSRQCLAPPTFAIRPCQNIRTSTKCLAELAKSDSSEPVVVGLAPDDDAAPCRIAW